MYRLGDGRKRKLKGYLQRIKKVALVHDFNSLPWWQLFREYYMACYWGQIKDADFVKEFGFDGELNAIEGFDLDTLTSEARVTHFINVIRKLQREGDEKGVSLPVGERSEPVVQPLLVEPVKGVSGGVGAATKRASRVKSVGQKKELISIKVEPELWEQIKEQAEREERSASALIRYAVKKYLESLE